MPADPFRIIAHRGASAYAPENTIAAFEKAVAMGVTEVETDLHFTKDGQVLLLHDHTLDRTTNGSGRPADYTLSQLKELDAGSWLDQAQNPDFKWEEDFAGEPLITLAELFARFGRDLNYHIEIKDRAPGIVPAAMEQVQAYGLVDKVFFYIADDKSFLLEAKRLEPRIRTELAPVQQLRKGAAEAIRATARAGHDIVALPTAYHSKELVELAHSCGMEARSLGIRNPQDMVDSVEAGSNGMTINWPDWLIDYIAAQT